MNFQIGKRVAVVGVGNVMMDIARYMIRERKVDQVIAIARRGPAEVKFDKKEMEYVIANLDQATLDSEIQRVTPIMQAVHQDPEAARASILEALPKGLPKVSETRFRFEFLASPVQMLGDTEGRLTQVEIEDNILVEANGDTKAKPEIWKEPAKFKEAEDKLLSEMPKVVAAARSGKLDDLKVARLMQLPRMLAYLR